LFDRADRLTDRRDRSFGRADRFRSHGFARDDRFVRRGRFGREHEFFVRRIFFVRHNFFVGFDFASFGWPWWGWDGWWYPPYDGYYPYYDDPSTYGSQYDDSQYSTEYWNNLAMSVQSKLAEQGYYHGQVDWIIGSGTIQAIRQFQADHGLPVTGRIDPKLLKALGLKYTAQG
jgi:hypothetical protein